MARRKLEVEIIGDSRKLERALGRSEKSLKRFGKATDSLGRGGGLVGALGGASGVAGLAGGAGLTFALGKAMAAAKESQIVMGQTGVAVDALGLDFASNAKRIEQAAEDMSFATAFDDEDVLRSFQVFVRQTKDIDEAFKRVELSSDVARGRYISLEQATQLVTKAGMGQVGALRRAGIQIDKTATATEALAALQKNYAGAAKQYSTEGAAAADRFKTALEGLAEEAGPPVLDFLAELTDGLTGVIRGFNGVEMSSEEAFQAIQDADFRQKLIDAFGVEGALLIKKIAATSPTASGTAASRVEDIRAGRYTAPSGNAPATGADLTKLQSLRVQQIKATQNDYLSDDLKVAESIAALLKLSLKGKTGKKLYDATVEWEQAKQDVYSIQQQIAQNAARDIKKEGTKTKSTVEKAAKATVDWAKKLRDQAEGFRDAALSALDRKEGGIDTARAITDAKEGLRHALQIGGSAGIKQAQRDLEDALLARQKFMLENAKITPSGGPGKTRGYTIVMNGVTIQASNPQELAAALQKLTRRTTTQSSGRRPGVGVF